MEAMLTSTWNLPQFLPDVVVKETDATAFVFCNILFGSRDGFYAADLFIGEWQIVWIGRRSNKFKIHTINQGNKYHFEKFQSGVNGV